MSDKKKGFTQKESRFIDEYMIHMNATRACINAGYSERSASVIGYENLRKPHIAAEIKRRMDQSTISAESAAKIISDIATTRLNDFMIIEKVLRRPTIRKGLSQLIDELQEEISFENEFVARVELPPEEIDEHNKANERRMQQIIRYQIELDRNPAAYRDVEGDAEYVDRVSVDMVALARAREQGRIKKLKFTEFGPEVELYSAEAAADKILHYHGKIVQNINHSGKIESPVTPEELEELRKEINGMGSGK